ncbi:MAG: hypothetical protein ACI8TP_002325 [Acidimicrobiales bacterium]
MTIRETIDGLMTDPSEQAAFQGDRAAYMAEHDLGDVPETLIDTAFVHFADTTSIENADALAPVVTRVGPVPFEETDLPDGITNELGEDDPPDPWAMLTFDTSTEIIEGDGETDPADLDDTPGLEAIEVVPDVNSEAGFGEGDAHIGEGFDSTDTGDDPFFDDNDMVHDIAEEAEGADSLPEPTANASVEYDYDADFADDVAAFTDPTDDASAEIDPIDLGFDD